MKEHHQEGGDNQLPILMNKAVDDPQEVDKREEHPGEERESGRILIGIELGYLRQERQWRRNAHAVHKVIKESLQTIG